jgi:prepilin peptidase CpaA
LKFILYWNLEHIITTLLPLFFQIPIFFLLLNGAIQDYRTRIVSNRLILLITIFSIPLLFLQESFLIPILLSILFLGLFYFTKWIGGADTKVLIILLLSMNTNEIFIFFFLFSISNIILIIRFFRSVPLIISILFGYLGIILLSFLPIVIRIIFGE